ncbi:gliding motility-associated-like protein [Lutibacter sp. Hel_I_33_5]|uniref:T9SS type B sorting domain-containing protein n=1 Tax=Lutibacter sp. Hel_I_33_5 TaxID=1566289 RepID=UPI00119DA674|nr:T9SS type B sorting domain-containing protein [Lutibacter sp. Hel_I_33_5]TVZ55467.1 gliding motility-associated-like protein [Lutibacter sp. Hel_I_33_5]
MKNYNPPRIIIFLLLCICTNAAFSQLSKKHYIPPITNAEFGNANPEDHYLYISTPSANNITYTIKLLGQPPASNITGTISNSTPLRVDIGTGYSQLFQQSSQTSTVTNNKGYIIEAQEPIYVSVRARAGGTTQAGALVSKGLSGLGKTFRVGSYTNENPQTNYLNFVSVMATEDNTNVVFSDLPAGISIKNYAGTLPVNVTLNEGESYIVATNSSESVINRDGLVGALVTSDNPIVVNVGSANGSFHNGTGRDFGIDQIVDISQLGKEYVFVKGDGLDGWENILIVAHTDNTSISINGAATPTTTINAGDYYLIEGNNFNVNGNMYVKTSENVFAYQGIGATTSEANQGMFLVPAISCENRGNVDNIPSIDVIGSTNYDGGLSIVTNVNETVSINGQDISNFAAQGPFNVSGKPNYVTYKVTGLTGNISVESTGELYCAYFNRNGVATSGSFYSGFPSPPEINFNSGLASNLDCIPNITLEAQNIGLFDKLEWFYDDGTGFVLVGTNSNTYKPTQGGIYKLRGTVTCSNREFESPIVPVSVCPTDYDNDNIIDNLDVDIDNDGILNCDESLGDATLNFNNVNQPSLIFLSGNTDTTFVTSTTNKNGISTVSGDITGNFTTQIPPSLSSDVDYTLTFNKPSSVEIIQNPSVSHTIITGENFSYKVGSNSKNITLIDPDNILLVDTNFDGAYETGVTNYSAVEIRFVFNPTPNGTTPFKFVSTNIDNLTFKHQQSNFGATTEFASNIKLKCFAKDTDNDGIEDAYDLDADNDGIPDLIEHTGNIITLSGNDDNSDGLDNIFNSLTIADTDNDGVKDYLDLDADNDGIYDVFEANHNLPDTNLDGIIDNATNLVGINGLVNNLETNTDNGILNYSVNDTDSDNKINAAELDSDNDGCFDVIEAGFIDNDSDNYIGQFPLTTNSNGIVTNATDGYTIPSTNYINFAPITINTAFVDVTFCEGTNPVITIDTTADSYQWEVSPDNGTTWSSITNNSTYLGATTASLQISNLSLSLNNYKYRVIQERTGNSCNETSNVISLYVNPLPTITNEVTLKECDTDVDGQTSFNLFDASILISTNYVNETFIFYPTLVDAQANTNALTQVESSNFISANDKKVWVRAISNKGCFRIAQINLTVSVTNIPNTFSRTFTACDDFLDTNGNNNSNNSDADGISSFNFSSVTQEIITSLGVSSDQITIEYFQNFANATLEQNKITDINTYRNSSSPGTQNIYVRVNSKLDATCFYIGHHITLNVTTIPVAQQVNNIELCDDLTDGNANNGIVQSFNLESKTAIILGGQNPNQINVTYHQSKSDATLGVNALTSPYTNIVNYQQTIYVRATNTTTNCFNDKTTFNLIVTPVPVANPVNTIEVCDTNTDGFVDSINLDSQTNTILGNQSPTNHTVTYHLTQNDADVGTNQLSSPFTNTIKDLQTIYVRVRNNTTNCHTSTTTFNVDVKPLPIANPVSNIELCDTDTDGFVDTFNLESQTNTILGNQNINNFTVTYHANPLDSNTGSNSLSSPFTNTIKDQQSIYVRIKNNTTNCAIATTSFNVIVNPLPVLSTINNIEVCDDNKDGFVDVFNLESQTPILLSGQNAANFTVTYHLSTSNANTGTNALSSPFKNLIKDRQTIYARVTNKLNNCFSNVTSFDIIVNPLPIVNQLNDIEICDNNTDGFVDSFNLESQTTILLGSQDPNKFTVTYHLTQNDADIGNNQLSSPFTNTTKDKQPIYVRIRNNTTNCFTSSTTFNVVVKPLPIANSVGNIELCDTDIDGFVDAFNLESQTNTILGNQDPNNFTVTYHLNFQDADTGNNSLSSPFTNTTKDQQTIYVRVKNNTSNCVIATTSFNVIVNPLPVLSTINNIEVCDDDTDGFVDVFNLESQTPILLSGQNASNFTVTYHLSQSNANTGTNALSSPFKNLIKDRQTIYARVTNKLNNCFNNVTSFDIIVNPLPIVNQLNDIEICDNNTDGFVDSFNLESQTTILLGSQDPNNFTVTYHLTQNDADIGNNQLNSPFTNTTKDKQPIYVRIRNNTTNCITSSSTFNVIVKPLPVINENVDLMACDIDVDGTTGFNLLNAIPLISTNFINEEFKFYTSFTDLQLDNNVLTQQEIANYNATNTAKVWVKVISSTGCFNIAQINLIVSVTNIPSSFSRTFTMCDDYLDSNGDDNQNNNDNDGISTFNFRSVQQELLGILGGNQNQVVIQYYKNQEDAQNQQNAIIDISNYRNSSAPMLQNIFTRVNSTIDSSCFYIGSHITLEVNNIPSAKTLPNLEICDNLNDGNAINGIVQSIDLESLSTTILGTQNPTDFKVTYHLSPIDAKAGFNAITSPFTNTIKDQQKIFVRVTNNKTGCFNNHTSFDIIVNPIPIAFATEDIIICDDDFDGLIRDIDLEQQTPIILGTQNTANLSVTYHVSPSDAASGENPLKSPFSLTKKNQQTIFIRVSNNATGCFTNETSFKVIVNPLPVLSEDVKLTQCDIDIDGIAIFNLQEALPMLSKKYTIEKFTFHSTKNDADNNLNAFSLPKTLLYVGKNNEEIWVRAASEFNCISSTKITLKVSVTNIPNTYLKTFSECDDFDDEQKNNSNNDGITFFNFSSTTQEITTLLNVSTEDITIKYYRNYTDAETDKNHIINPSSYRNIGYPNTQNIYVRVTNTSNNSCIYFGHHITLKVNPSPTAQPVQNLEVCDNLSDIDATNGVVQNFDLESQTSNVLGNLNASDFTVTYHISELHANEGVKPLISPYTNANRDRQTIYVRVTNKLTGCFSSNTNFDLIVNPLPISNFVEDLQVCDDDFDGFAYNINLRLQTATILGSQSSNKISVRYFLSKKDAKNNENPILKAFDNTIAHRQTIYVSVTNLQTQCRAEIKDFDVIINKKPRINYLEEISTLVLCDDAFDGDPRNRLVQNIDLSVQLPELLAGNQNIEDYNITFYTNADDAFTGLNPLETAYANSKPQETIYARIQHKITGCFNSNASFRLIVYPLPELEVETPQVLCLNNPITNLRVVNPTEQYSYHFEDPEGNIVSNSYQVDVSKGGDYKAVATNPETGCFIEKVIHVLESNAAFIAEKDITVIEEKNNNSIIINIKNNNLGPGDYEFSLLNRKGEIVREYQDEPVFENLKGGFYTILIRDKYGCDNEGIPTSFEISVIELPTFFTPNNDGVNDTWTVRGADSTTFPTSEIYIYNRFGKVIKEIKLDGNGWDGTFNGKVLDSGDYWVSVYLVDKKGKVRDHKSHFSLIKN